MRISEHHQYIKAQSYSKRVLEELEELKANNRFSQSTEVVYFKNEKNENRICIQVTPDEKIPCIRNSYFIGIDRLPESKIVVCVEPKVNTEYKKLDSLKMLVEALKDPENLNHLDGLLDVKYSDPWIEDRHQSSNLTPFVILEFLMILKNIVRKSLKKDYFHVVNNLNAKVKGKICITDQIKYNTFRNKYNSFVCKYQQHGFDNEANRFLKFVLAKASLLLTEMPSLYCQFKDDLHYLNGVFELVGHQKFTSFHKKESNPFFKNYNTAIDLGNLILKLSAYDLDTANSQIRKVPPHWIDMSKLFELYVFKKLREHPLNKVVEYHVKVHYQEPDILARSQNGPVIIDAKYKPRYKSGNPSKDDARQLAGYSRLNGIIKRFMPEEGSLMVLPVYFVYPKEFAEIDDETSDEEPFEENAGFKILDGNVREAKAYFKMFLQEIDLPYI